MTAEAHFNQDPTFLARREVAIRGNFGNFWRNRTLEISHNNFRLFNYTAEKNASWRLNASTHHAKPSIPLENDALAIGRSHENDVVINHEKVSRQHARIERKGEIFFVKMRLKLELAK